MIYSLVSPHGRSTTDAILALRLLFELHQEFNRPLHVAYVDRLRLCGQEGLMESSQGNGDATSAVEAHR